MTIEKKYANNAPVFSEERKKMIDIMKIYCLKLSELYNKPLKIEIDTNSEMKACKLKITETNL